MGWILFIDDTRNPSSIFKSLFDEDTEITVCRSSKEAIEKVKELGIPRFISFDHDLGDTDTSMVLKNSLECSQMGQCRIM